MTRDAETLLPCPFCGSENVKLFPATCHQSTPYDPADRMYPVAQCWNCHAGAVGNNNDGTRDVRETQSAATAWNTRAALEAMEPRVKALNEVAIPALEFFADDENWRLNGKLDPNGPNFIGRIHARAALSALTKETTP